MKRFCLEDQWGAPLSPVLCEFGILEAAGAAIGIGSAAAGAGAGIAGGVAAAGADAGIGAGIAGGLASAAGAGAGILGGVGDFLGSAASGIGDALGGAANWIGNELGIGGGATGANAANATYNAGTMGMGPTAIGSSGGLGSLGPATSNAGLFGTGIGGVGGPVGSAGGIGGTVNTLGLLAGLGQLAQNSKRPNYGITPGPSTTAATAGPYFNAMPQQNYVNRTLQPIQPASGNWSTYGETGEPQFYQNNQISNLTQGPPGSARGGRIGNKKGYALGGGVAGPAPGATDFAPIVGPQQQFGAQPMRPWQQVPGQQMSQPPMMPWGGGRPPVSLGIDGNPPGLWGQRPGMNAPGTPPMTPGPTAPYARTLSDPPGGPAPGVPNMSGFSGLPNFSAPQLGAMGGFARGGALSHLARGGHGAPVFETERGDHHVQGPGDGKSDSINARLSADEYVFDAGSVSRLGNGSSKEGARRLEMIRKAIHRDTKSKGVVQRKAKSPLEYLKEARR